VNLTNGAVVTIDVATEPNLKGQQHALGTGPMLVRHGKLHEVTARMSEQKHPRAAIGWNERYLFLGVSDGRRKGVSEGIKLSEMAEFMIDLGCDEVINMDGGQSTTLILNGEILNAQTPGGKHEVANGVVILRRPIVDDDDDVEK
jgi:exopolysaccharide biosynthesis protein